VPPDVLPLEEPVLGALGLTVPPVPAVPPVVLVLDAVIVLPHSLNP
jgi:hypothetical protein